MKIEYSYILVKVMYDAVTECQELHPDPDDEDSDEEEGEEDISSMFRRKQKYLD